MESKQKLFYDAPSTMTVEMSHEGIICLSDPVTSGNPNGNWFGDEEEM